MSDYNIELLENFDIDEVLGDLEPSSIGKCAVALLLATARPDMNYLFTHDRWVLPHLIHTFGEPDEPFDAWTGLRKTLCRYRDYFRWRQSNPSEPLPTEAFVIPGQPDDFVQGVIEVCEPIYAFHDRRRSFGRLIDALPDDADPTSFDDVCDMCGKWYLANRERCDIAYEANLCVPTNVGVPIDACVATSGSTPTPDEQWVTIADRIKLQQKLAACPIANTMLDELNRTLRARKVGTLTLEGVAAIACVFRKNILKQNGEVPVTAIEQFFLRSNTFGKPRRLHHLQIGVARDILLGCEFMAMVRPARKDEHRCAVYKLLNPTQWQ